MDDIFNFKLMIELFGGKRKVSKEIIDSFISKYLPQHVQEINEAIVANDSKQLLQAVHKLHGAVCYFGTPRLESVAEELELALKEGKKKQKDIDKLCTHLFKEINAVSKAYTHYFSKNA